MRKTVYAALPKGFGNQYFPYTLVYENGQLIDKMHWGNPGTREQAERQIAQLHEAEERIAKEMGEKL